VKVELVALLEPLVELVVLGLVLLVELVLELVAFVLELVAFVQSAMDLILVG
jgi:hypothetical protein